MQHPQVPDNESERLAKLRSFELLDTLSEAEFDNIVELASSICKTPISLISLIDADRQWFKARRGLSPTETPRVQSFCAHAINTPGKLFEVPNALEDLRFHDNPLVTGDPNIRFYAGSPLMSADGYALGTLCVIDSVPRQLDDTQKHQLKLLADQLMMIIEYRKRLLTQKEALSEALKKSEAAVQQKNQFMSTLSHEIRTPLNAIIGTINLMELERPELKYDERFKLLRFGGNNLLSLINDALDYQKIEAGMLEIDETDFDLYDLAEQIIATWTPMAGEKALDLQLHIDRQLAKGYVGDKVRIGQILNNLLSNALKFTREGMVQLTVNSAGESIHFEVRDTGPGIEEKHLELIFEQFGQAGKSETEKSGGTGLGLNISQKLVALMGGRMGVNSEPGFGSAFWFELPLKGSDAVIHADDLDSVAEPVYPLYVLLAEDNAGNQAIATGFLHRWGMRVDIAHDGKEAVQKVQEASYDLVLMDIHMPHLNGYDATRAIRSLEGEHYQEIPIVALTASAPGEVMEKIKASGMNDFVSKPFHPKELFEKISNVTGREVKKPADTTKAQSFTFLQTYFGEDKEQMYAIIGKGLSSIKTTLAKMEATPQPDAGFYHSCYHDLKPSLTYLDLAHLYDELPEPEAEDFDARLQKVLRKIKTAIAGISAPLSDE